MVGLTRYHTRLASTRSGTAVYVTLVSIAQFVAVSGGATAQDSINSQFRRTPSYTTPLRAQQRAQQCARMDALLNAPRRLPPTVPGTPEADAAKAAADIEEVLSSEVTINAEYMGRAALIEDNSKLADFSQGNFLPSAIPVAGQPFFNSPWRSTLQGSGNAVRLNVTADPEPDLAVSGHAQVLVQSANLSLNGTGGDTTVSFREAFGRINRLSMGLIETAFADPGAVPETLDLAGPNARLTVQPAGFGDCQGRLSYDFFSDGQRPGFMTTVSVEQPRPQIATSATTATYAKYPDFISALQYTDGYIEDGTYNETWHVQFGSIVRNLGLQDDTNTFNQTVFGWGTSLSGSYRFTVNPDLCVRDRVVFSVTYGEGISHYITDLNAAGDANDAVLNGANNLVALPVLAWYAGYTHNWTDYVRSTATFSKVNLDSVVPLNPVASPYRIGEYAAVNLLYHNRFFVKTATDPEPHNFYTGLEYLFGHKETLDGASGECIALCGLR